MEELEYTFYKRYLWKEIVQPVRADHAPSGRVIRFIYFQFGNHLGINNLPRMWWLKHILPYLCHKNPCVETLYGHKSRVTSVVKMNETSIISMDRRGNLRAWDLANNQCTSFGGLAQTLYNIDRGPVIKLNNNTIIEATTVGDYRCMRFHVNDNGRYTMVREMARRGSNSVTSLIKWNESTIVSGGDKGDICVWDLEKDTCRELSSCEPPPRHRWHMEMLGGLGPRRPWGCINSLIKLDNTTVASGCSDGTVRLWSINSKKSFVLEGHTDKVTSLIKLNDVTIVSGSWDCTLHVWYLRDDDRDNDRVLHSNHIVSLLVKMSETTFVSGTYDRTLCLWDLNKNPPGPYDIRGTDAQHSSLIKLNDTTLISGCDGGPLIKYVI